MKFTDKILTPCSSGSHENIKCERTEFRPPSLEFHVNEGSDDDEEEEGKFENLRDREYRHEDTNLGVEEDLEAADRTTQGNQPTNYNMGCADNNGRESRALDKDGTIFEKYFDSMSRWSIGTEIQI